MRGTHNSLRRVVKIFRAPYTIEEGRKKSESDDNEPAHVRAAMSWRNSDVIVPIACSTRSVGYTEGKIVKRVRSLQSSRHPLPSPPRPYSRLTRNPLSKKMSFPRRDSLPSSGFSRGIYIFRRKFRSPLLSERFLAIYRFSNFPPLYAHTSGDTVQIKLHWTRTKSYFTELEAPILNCYKWEISKSEIIISNNINKEKTILLKITFLFI